MVLPTALTRVWALPGRRWFAALGLAAGGVAVGAVPATAATTAGVDTGPAAAAFHQGAHVYVYPGGSVLLDSATQAKITTALAGSSVYLSVVRTPALSQSGATAVNAAIVAAAGRRGSYVLLGVGGAGTFLQVSSPVSPQVYGLQLHQATAAHHDDPAAQALDVVTALRGDALPTKPFPWTGVIVGVGLGVAALLSVFVTWSRASRRRAVLVRRKDDATRAVESLLGDLETVDPGGRVALRDPGDPAPEQRALRVAWSRQQGAESMLTDTANRATVERARYLCRQGAAAVDQVRRLRDGVPAVSAVLALAEEKGGPDPADRRDGAAAEAPTVPTFLSHYTAASYPGCEYGWYPGHGFGFFGYTGSFVEGILAGEGLADAFEPWGGPDGFGDHAGYDAVEDV